MYGVCLVTLGMYLNNYQVNNFKSSILLFSGIFCLYQHFIFYDIFDINETSSSYIRVPTELYPNDQQIKILYRLVSSQQNSNLHQYRNHEHFVRCFAIYLCFKLNFVRCKKIVFFLIYKVFDLILFIKHWSSVTPSYHQQKMTIF